MPPGYARRGRAWRLHRAAGERAAAGHGRRRGSAAQPAARLSATRAAAMPAAPLARHPVDDGELVVQSARVVVDEVVKRECLPGGDFAAVHRTGQRGRQRRGQAHPVLVVPAARGGQSGRRVQAGGGSSDFRVGDDSASVTCGATASAARIRRSATPARSSGGMAARLARSAWTASSRAASSLIPVATSTAWPNSSLPSSGATVAAMSAARAMRSSRSSAG